MDQIDLYQLLLFHLRELAESGMAMQRKSQEDEREARRADEEKQPTLSFGHTASQAFAKTPNR